MEGSLWGMQCRKRVEGSAHVPVVALAKQPSTEEDSPLRLASLRYTA